MDYYYFILLCTIIETVPSYDLICPSAGHWKYRADKDCAKTEKYVCLLETVEEIKVEACTGPRKEVDGFQTTINKGHFDNIKCFPDRYQPVIFTTEGNSKCVFQKSMCSEEGQILYDPNDVSRESDRGCICNFIEGYALIRQEKDSCFCVPSNVTDCACFKKTCAPDEVLTQDYECIRRVQIGYDLKDKKCKKIIHIGTTDTEDDYKKEEVKYYERITLKGSHNSASIAVAVILLLMALTFLAVLLIFEERKGVKQKGFLENVEAPTIDLNVEKPAIDFNVEKPTIDLNGEKPTIDLNVEKPTIDLNETILNEKEEKFETPPSSPSELRKNISEKNLEERGPDKQTATDSISLNAEEVEKIHRDRPQDEGTQNNKISSEDVVDVNKENCTDKYPANDNYSTPDITPSNIQGSYVNGYTIDDSELTGPLTNKEISKVKEESGATDTGLTCTNVQSKLDTTDEHQSQSDHEMDKKFGKTDNSSEGGNSNTKPDIEIIEERSDDNIEVLDISTTDGKNPDKINEIGTTQIDSEGMVQNKQQSKMENKGHKDFFEELKEKPTVSEALPIPDDEKDGENFKERAVEEIEKLLELKNDKDEEASDGYNDDGDNKVGDSDDCEDKDTDENNDEDIRG